MTKETDPDERVIIKVQRRTAFSKKWMDYGYYISGNHRIGALNTTIMRSNATVLTRQKATSIQKQLYRTYPRERYSISFEKVPTPARKGRGQ